MGTRILVTCLLLVSAFGEGTRAQPLIEKKPQAFGPRGPNVRGGSVSGAVIEIGALTVTLRLNGVIAHTFANGKIVVSEVVVRDGKLFTFRLSPAMAAGGLPQYDADLPQGLAPALVPVMNIPPGMEKNRFADLKIGDAVEVEFSRFDRLEAFRFVRRVGETPPELIAPPPRERIAPRIPFAKP